MIGTAAVIADVVVNTFSGKGVPKMRVALKVLLLVMIVVSAVPAFADTYFLNIDQCTGGCGVPPFGSISLTQGANANTVHFLISLNAGNFIHTGQDGSTLGLNIDGNPTIALSNVTLPGWTLDNPNAGVRHAAAFGDFEYSLNCCFGNNGAPNS